jgi:hypothetical protein
MLASAVAVRCDRPTIGPTIGCEADPAVLIVRAVNGDSSKCCDETASFSPEHED